MACIYRDKNNCKKMNNICPWVFWCSKINGWKERAGMEKYCKYLKNKDVPNGYFLVAFEKKGYLYINMEDETIKIKNPFNYIPDFVKIYKSKDEWKIRKEKENKV